MRPALAALALWMAVVACGDDTGADVGASPAPSEVVAEGMVVRDAWTRPTPATAGEAAIYVEIENLDSPADRLLGGRSDRCVSVVAHRTTVDDAGVATMAEAGAGELDLPPGGRVTLAPTGLHLMCVGLSEPLAPGDDVELELVFERHPTIAVPVVIEQR